MKKVLFATTALVASVSVASAEVALSGSAEIGVRGGDGEPESFFTDIDVTFTLSGETDNGLTFGATIDLDESVESDAFADDVQGGETIFITGQFGTLTLGDTDGALDWGLTEAAVGNAGSLADDETEHAGYLGSYGDGAYDGQILRYDYGIGDFAFAVSFEVDDENDRDDGYAIGFRYGFDFGGGSVDLGAGYQFIEVAADVGEVDVAGATVADAALLGGELVEVDIYGFSAAVDLDLGLSVGIAYTEFSNDVADVDHFGIGAGYTFDAFTISANYGQFDVSGAGDIEGYGVAAAYDLGGGASIHFGYGNSDIDGEPEDTETYSFGVAMSF